LSFPYLQNFLGLGSGLQTKNAAGGGGVGGWVELGRTTLGSPADTITISSLANKRYYMVLGHGLQTGGSAAMDWQFNSDGGTNYSNRYSDLGAADGTNVNGTKILSRFSEIGSVPSFGVGYISNYATKEKLMLGHTVNQNTAGVAKVPERYEYAGKWANTTDAINSIRGYNSGGGDLDTNTELVILGYDPADSHSTNTWAELASDSATGSTTNTNTLTFTSKKYLWIQLWHKTNSTSGHPFLTVGNGSIDTGSNYAVRRSLDGGSDSTFPSTIDGLDKWTDLESATGFTNYFIVNVSSKEKLCIAHGVRTTSGAGTSPNRAEWASKWGNTSNQIDRIRWSISGGTTLDWSAKVWGFD
jgi:hypothetical protein